MIKKIINFIVQPFALVSHRNISEKISMFFSRHKVFIYLVSFLVTVLLILIAYAPL